MSAIFYGYMFLFFGVFAYAKTVKFKYEKSFLGLWGIAFDESWIPPRIIMWAPSIVIFGMLGTYGMIGVFGYNEPIHWMQVQAIVLPSLELLANNPGIQLDHTLILGICCMVGILESRVPLGAVLASMFAVNMLHPLVETLDLLIWSSALLLTMAVAFGYTRLFSGFNDVLPNHFKLNIAWRFLVLPALASGIAWIVFWLPAGLINVAIAADYVGTPSKEDYFGADFAVYMVNDAKMMFLIFAVYANILSLITTYVFPSKNRKFTANNPATKKPKTS